MGDKPKVDFNLDSYERESAPGPFAVVVGGRRYELVDAQECDYRDLLQAQQAFAAGDPQRSFDMIVKEDDREAFFANRLPNYKLRALFERYNAHYGIPIPGEANGSSPS